jgi:hypothetical protein
MIWSHETSEQIDKRRNDALRPAWEEQQQWHAWFAWWPVKVAPDRSAWLQFVQRRITPWDAQGELKWYTWDIRDFEYRLPQ